YCIEAMMQDKKALQAGTSHNLGQNFAKAFNIEFEGRDQTRQHVHTTSWGVSTRLIGALIMSHSDDEGLILPPKVAPTLAVIIPIWKGDDQKDAVLAYADKVAAALCGEVEVADASNRVFGEEKRVFFDRVTNQTVTIDQRDRIRPGDKHFHWEQRGVPYRLEIGPRDVESGKVVIKSRLGGDKEIVDLAELTREGFASRLEEFQAELFNRAKAFRDENTFVAETKDELYQRLNDKEGFVRCFLSDNADFENQVKADTKGTVRLIYSAEHRRAETGTCIATGQTTDREVVFGIAY
ncbi:MAG: proline--tRNA ligase, partial [Planctomycetes bacterium]|nr:proline--tRNA ligase [Planctomycetota bacterium]